MSVKVPGFGLKLVELQLSGSAAWPFLPTVNSGTTPLCGRQQAADRESVVSAVAFKRFVNKSPKVMLNSVFNRPGLQTCVARYRIFLIKR